MWLAMPETCATNYLPVNFKDITRQVMRHQKQAHANAQHRSKNKIIPGVEDDDMKRLSATLKTGRIKDKHYSSRGREGRWENQQKRSYSSTRKRKTEKLHFKPTKSKGHTQG